MCLLLFICVCTIPPKLLHTYIVHICVILLTTQFGIFYILATLVYYNHQLTLKVHISFGFEEPVCEICSTLLLIGFFKITTVRMSHSPLFVDQNTPLLLSASLSFHNVWVLSLPIILSNGN